MQAAVFLDRDNTLIHNDGDLGDPESVRLVDDVAPGLRALREAGYRLIVVTNQGGVARGRFTEEDVDAVHQRIAGLVDQAAGAGGLIERFYYCPYHPEATVAEYRRDHPWRKPNPGMILQAARDMGLDLSQSWLIGDQARDIAAGKAAGCRTVIVAPDPAAARDASATAGAGSFTEAVNLILSSTPKPGGAKPGALRGSPSAPHVNGAESANGAAAGANLRAGPGTHPYRAHPLRHLVRHDLDLTSLSRALHELTDEVRSERLRRSDFTLLRMAAGLGQLLTILLALLALLQLSAPDAFYKWMFGAVLCQLFTISLLLADARG